MSDSLEGVTYRFGLLQIVSLLMALITFVILVLALAGVITLG